MECLFCGKQEDTTVHERGSNFVINCTNCGKFAVTSELNYQFRQQNDEKINAVKTKCAHLLTENRLNRSGNILLYFEKFGTIETFLPIKLSEFLQKYPDSASELIERAFRNLANCMYHPAECLIIDRFDINLLFARYEQDIFYILRQFVNRGYISVEPDLESSPLSLNIEAKGWEYYNQIKSRSISHSTQVFVAMWFDERRQSVYELGIKPAVEESANYRCTRVDAVQHNNKICDQIIAEIRKSKFMVADFTGNRGGVYFEAGFAQGLGIPVIWIVDKKHEKKLHFDTRQYNHITYKDAEDLRVKLRARIEATIV